MSLSKKIGITLAALLAAVFIYGWFRFVVPTRYAVSIGAGLLAKQVCSCVYLAQRELDDCRADQMEAMDQIKVEVLRDDERVRAWVSGFGERVKDAGTALVDRLRGRT